jgi:hypothetical protein
MDPTEYASPSLHLKIKTDTDSEMLSFLVILNSGRWTKSTNAVILCNILFERIKSRRKLWEFARERNDWTGHHVWIWQRVSLIISSMFLILDDKSKWVTSKHLRLFTSAWSVFTHTKSWSSGPIKTVSHIQGRQWRALSDTLHYTYLTAECPSN